MATDDEDDLDRVEELFLRAKDLSEAEQRAFLDRECGDDSELRSELERYLGAHLLSTVDGADGFAKRIHDRMSQALGAGPAVDQFVGRRFGSYLVTQRIAAGGMGIVYEARQDKPARRVALKVIPPDRLHDDVARARFDDEVDALARLDHPAIATVYEAGSQEIPSVGVVPFFAMEFIDGAKSISSYCEKHHLPRPARLRLLAQVCDAVHHAHQNGILHRDLKPSNILVDRCGNPKVIDFGIARALAPGRKSITLPNATPGTPEYMSPEQWESGAHVDVRSDVYALGAVAFVTLADRLPFDIPEHASDTTRIAIIRSSEPHHLKTIDRKCHPDLDAILAAALARDPAGRYQSASALADDIRRRLNGESTYIRPPKLVGRAARFVMRKPWQSVTMLVSALLVVGALVLIQIRSQKETIAEKSRLLDIDRYRLSVLTAEMASRDRDFEGAARALQGLESRGWEHDHLRNRTAAWIGRVQGFKGRVVDIAISPNGADVVVRTNNHRVYAMKLADFLSADGVASSPLDFRAVLGEAAPAWKAAALCANGRILCCSPERPASSGMVVYDLTSRTPKHLVVAMPELSAMAGHPVEPIVAVGSTDGMVRFWSLEKNVQVGETPPMRGTSAPMVRCLQWSRTGTRLAVASEGREIKIFDVSDVAKPVELACIVGHFLHVEGLAWSDDGRTLASASGDKTVKIWDVARTEAEHEGVEVATLVGHIGSVLSVGFVPHFGLRDGRYALATGSADGTVRFWEVQTRRKFIFRPDRTGVARPEDTPWRGHGEVVRSVGVSPDGSTILSGSEDGTVRAWSAAAIEVVPELRGHLTSVTCVAFSHDGSQIASFDPECKLVVWDPATGIGFKTAIASEAGSVDGSISWHPRLPVLAIGCSDGRVGLYDMRISAQPRLIKTLAPPSPPSPEVGKCDTIARRGPVSFSRDGSTLACVTGVNALWWELDLSDPCTVRGSGTIAVPAGARLTCIASSPDGRLVAIGGAGGDCRAFVHLVARTNPSSAPRIRRGALGTVESLSFSPDGSQLAAGGDLGSTPYAVWLWNLETDGVRELVGHTARTYAVAWHPKEKRLASSAYDRTIALWDSADAIAMGMLRGNVSLPRALAFSPDGRTLASAMNGAQGTENVVKLWETEATPEHRVVRAQLRECAGLIDQAIVNPGETQAVIADRIGTMSLREVDAELGDCALRFGESTIAKLHEVWARRRALRTWPAIAAGSVPAPGSLSQLDLLEGALRAAPADPLVQRAVGAASYRAGALSDALALLLAADEGLRKSLNRSDYADAAFLAMTFAGLRREAEARHWSAILDAVLPPEDSQDFVEASALRREVQTALSAGPTSR